MRPFVGTVSPSRPDIATIGNTVLLAWTDARHGSAYNGNPGEVYVGRSTDGGSTWTQRRLTFTARKWGAGSTARPVICAGSNGTVTVVWQDPDSKPVGGAGGVTGFSSPGTENLYWAHSADGGSTWGRDGVFVNGPNEQNHAYLVQIRNVVGCDWADSRFSPAQMRFRLSTDGGATFGAPVRPMLSPADSAAPRIVASRKLPPDLHPRRRQRHLRSAGCVSKSAHLASRRTRRRGSRRVAIEPTVATTRPSWRRTERSTLRSPRSSDASKVSGDGANADRSGPAGDRNRFRVLQRCAFAAARTRSRVRVQRRLISPVSDRAAALRVWPAGRELRCGTTARPDRASSATEGQHRHGAWSVRTLAVDALRMAGHRTAGGRHVEYLAFEWSRMEIPFDRVVLMAPRPFELPSMGTTTEVVIEVFERRLPLVVWEQVALPLRARSLSILFCPSYIAPLASKAPVVVANHGIYERIPDEFSRIQRLRSTTLHRLSARRATRTIANSLNTQMDVADFFRVPIGRIDVVYPAANHVFFADHDQEAIEAEVERVLGAPVPYLIFVGKLSRRRHIPELVEAFARLRAIDAPAHRLLWSGRMWAVSTSPRWRARTVSPAR